MDESFYSTKGGRRKSQSRKSGGRGKARGREGTPNKRPRPASLSPRGGGRSDGSDGSGDGGSGGGGGQGASSAKKAKKGVPGEKKARALAVVKRFVSTLPPIEYGRDEGLVANKDEAKEARNGKSSPGGGGGGGGGGRGATGGGGKRDRATASEKGDGQSREKKAKKLKSSREERKREETDSKLRISQVRRPSLPSRLSFRLDAESSERANEWLPEAVRQLPCVVVLVGTVVPRARHDGLIAKVYL